MWSFLFVFLAAAFNGLMDVVTHHYEKSIFKDLPKQWWNPNLSWMSVKPLLGWVRIDAWHLFKFGMIFSFVAAICFYEPVFSYDALLLLLTWGIGFEITYKFTR